jgi:metallo-beta-lactamase family protein
MVRRRRKADDVQPAQRTRYIHKLLPVNSLSLTFLGAAETVTGSKHLLEAHGKRILVDCGLFQGLKELRQRNWQPLPLDAASLDAVVLTHAHLDHCGYLPKLIAAGYRGRIWCTGATKDLCSIVLPDSAHIQEEDARDANRYRYSKHDPALPLYTSADAARALTHLQPVGYERAMPIADGVEVEFVNAGHLLGSAYARVRAGGRTVLFGGDLGRYGRPVLPDPSPPGEADVLLLESTYGDRLHPPDDDGAKMAEIINATHQRGGKVIIPSFAIGRVEEVLYWLQRLEADGRIPVLPVYVDSPMAIAALRFYSGRLSELDPFPAADPGSDPGSDPASDPGPGSGPMAAQRTNRFATARLTTVASAQQSADLVASRKPAIVIASSGMATGGRVLHHLEAALPDARNTVLFVGFQAPGTRGRLLVDGATQVRLHGRDIPVAAQIEQIHAMSAHADAGEILRWLSGFARPPKMTYLVHGEPSALDTLAATIARDKQWPVHVARYRERVELP